MTTPASHSARTAEIRAQTVRDAEALSNRSYELAEALRASGGKFGPLQFERYIEFLQAAMTVIQDDSLPDALETAEEEYVEVSRLGRRAA